MVKGGKKNMESREKIIISQKKTVSHKLTVLFLWCHQESNRGHKDFQSFALPTELWHLSRLRLQRYTFYLILQTYGTKFCVIS